MIFRSLPGCSIDKTEAPFKITGYSRQGRGQKVMYGYPEVPGMCDYEGGYFGRHCLIEAKRHDGKKRRWNFNLSIRKNQHERMRRGIYFKEIPAVLLCWDDPADSGATPYHWFWIPYLAKYSSGK